MRPVLDCEHVFAKLDARRVMIGRSTSRWAVRASVWRLAPRSEVPGSRSRGAGRL